MEEKDKYLKSFAHIQARNVRYVFIVDSKSDIDEILELCYNNQRYWGGRYNPIIPSIDGKVPKQYLELASKFDPDYVICVGEIDIDDLKSFFNPIEYRQCTFHNINLEGLDAYHLLEYDGYDTVLFSSYLYKTLPNLYSFYKLNFDFCDRLGDEELFNSFEKIHIDTISKKELDEIIAYNHVRFSSLLSRLNVQRPILKCDINLQARIELIVSDENNQLNDLLYYWNRQLYLDHDSHFLRQLYVTKTQLAEFIQDNPTTIFFAALTGARDIPVTSYSIEAQELSKILEKLNTWQKSINFHSKDVVSFPFEIKGFYRSNSQYEEPELKQSIIGTKDLVHIPNLSFLRRGRAFGELMIDVLIERDENSSTNQILFPLKSDHQILVCSQKGRINKYHSLSLQISNEDKFLDFKVPTEEEICRSLLVSSSSKESKIYDIATGSDGLRLSSLLKLFRYNYHVLDNYFHNKFWLDIFRSKSIMPLKDDRIKKSKGIVSMLDLEAEYKYMFEQEKVEFEEKYLSKEFDDLNHELEELVELGVYFIGKKIRCQNCGSVLWYSLSELNSTMSCKGCFHTVRLKIESKEHYKLNDTVRNSLISNSGSSKDTHGNLTVLHTLLSKQIHSKKSFYCLPSQDFYEYESASPISDIDIICVSDGVLTIGEAKNSVKEFTQKVADNLVYLSNNIQPDELILAFKEGELKTLEDYIKKIEARLINKRTKVIGYKTFDSYYTSGNLNLAKAAKKFKGKKE